MITAPGMLIRFVKTGKINVVALDVEFGVGPSVLLLEHSELGFPSAEPIETRPILHSFLSVRTRMSTL